MIAKFEILYLAILIILDLLKNKKYIYNIIIEDKNKILVITNGDQGSTIFTGNEELNIPTPKVDHPKDPTGCGDAYRAGIVYGINKKMTLEKIGELSSELGALKVASFGTQNHTFDDKIKKLL